MSPQPRHQLPVTDPDELAVALTRLGQRDRSLLQMRYGLKGTRPHNLREIAKVMGISRERVRQLETRAIERLAGHAGVPLADAASADASASRASSRHRRPSSRHEFVCRWTLMLLALSPGHVYELRKRFTELGVPPVTYRQLYGLEDEGLVSSSWTPSHRAGPHRRVYTVTREGLEQLEADSEMFAKAAETIREFLAAGTR